MATKLRLLRKWIFIRPGEPPGSWSAQDGLPFENGAGVAYRQRRHQESTVSSQKARNESQKRLKLFDLTEISVAAPGLELVI